MFKRLRWVIIIPGVLVSFAQAQTTALTVQDIVEKDLFQLHSPAEDLAQKDYQSAEYKVTYLANPAPTKEEQALLMDSASILSNRDWFLRRMEKNEEPAKQWMKDHGLTQAQAIAAQKVRLKNAVIGYNKLVTNVVEKRNTPKPGSVATETLENCGSVTGPEVAKTETANGGITFAPPAVANLSNDFFGIRHYQISDETKTDSDKLVAAAKRDDSYITPDSTFKISSDTIGSINKTGQIAQARSSLNLNSSVYKAGNAIGGGYFTNRKIGAVDAPEGQGLANPNIPEKEDTTTSSSPVRVARGFNSIVHVPGSATKLYAISQDGTSINLYTSDDGTNWTAAIRIDGISKGASAHIHVAVSENEKDIVVTTDLGAFVSTDKGLSFKQIGEAGSEAVDVKISDQTGQMVIGFKSPTFGSNGQQDGGSSNDVMVFEKQNGSWTPSANQPVGLDKFSAAQAEATKGTDASRIFSPNGVHLQSVQIDPIHPGVFYAGTGNQLFRWDPNQKAWSNMSNGVLDDTTVYAIDFDQKTGKMLMATCNGVYEGDDNNSSSRLTRVGNGAFLWSQGKGGDNAPDDPTAHHALPSRSNSLRAYDVVVDPYNQNKILATADTGVYVSKNGGVNWTRLEGGDWQDDSVDKKESSVRTATWLQDGSVIFTGESAKATFRAVP